MSTIKLKGSSSGEAEVTVAAAAGTPTFTLPTTVGSANQLVKNSGTAGTLQYSSLVEDSSGRVGIGTTATDKNSRSFLNIHQASSDANYMYFTNSTTGEAGSDGFTIGLDSDEKAMLWNRENTDIRLATNATERLTIKANGHVSIVSGNLEFANGAGIDFSNVPDGSRSIGTDGNKFDDYEEGSFTPTVVGGTSAGTTNHTHRTGRYVKVGKLVTCHVYANWTSADGTGNMEIGGLPFACDNDTSDAGLQQAGPVMVNNLTFPTNHEDSYLVTHSWYGISYLRLYACGHNLSWEAQQMEGAGAVIFTVTYSAA